MRTSFPAVPFGLVAGCLATALGAVNDLRVGDTWTYRFSEQVYRTALQEDFQGISRLSILDSATRNDTVLYTVKTVDSGLYRGEGPADPRDTVLARLDTIGYSGNRFLGINPDSRGIGRPALFLDYFSGLKILHCTAVYSGDTARMELYQGYEGSSRWLPQWGVISQELCIGCGGGRNSSSREQSLVSKNGRKYEWDRFAILDTIQVTGLGRRFPSLFRSRPRAGELHSLDGRLVPGSARFRPYAPGASRPLFQSVAPSAVRVPG